MGSEGTLGVITKQALRLQKRPNTLVYRAKLNLSLEQATQEAKQMHEMGSLAEEIELLSDGQANLYISNISKSNQFNVFAIYFYDSDSH